MRTFSRSVIFASLVTAGLVLILSPFALDLLRTTSNDPSVLRRVLSGLVIALGILCNELAFLIVPASVSMGRRILHHKGMAIVAVLGLLGLGMLDWSRLPAFLPFWDVAVRWPLVLVGVFYFIGYTVVSAVIQPLPPGSPRVPGAVRRILHSDEKVLYRIQQSRLMSPITPHNLVATNQRLVVHQPANLGLTHSLHDYQYRDIANVKIERGLVFSVVSMKERWAGEDMVFENMPRQRTEKFAQIVTDQIHRSQTMVPGTVPGTRHAANP